MAPILQTDGCLPRMYYDMLFTISQAGALESEKEREREGGMDKCLFEPSTPSDV